MIYNKNKPLNLVNIKKEMIRCSARAHNGQFFLVYLKTYNQ